MPISGLRLRVFGSYFLLTSIGMLLISLLLSVLFYRAFVISEVDYARSLLKSCSLQVRDDCKTGRVALLAQLSQLTKSAGITCKDIYIFELNKDLFSLNSSRHSDVLPVLKQTALLQIAMTKEIDENILSIFKKRLVILTIPKGVDSERRDSMGLLYEIPSVHNLVDKFQVSILIYIIFNSLILAFVGYLRTSKTFFQPMEKLVQATGKVTDTGDISFPVPDHTDEFHKLSLGLNQMVSRVGKDKELLKSTIVSLREANKQLNKAQNEIIQTEKLAAVGRLSAGLAHEIGNPIGIVQGYVELLGQETTEIERDEFVQRSTEELLRVQMLVQQLLDCSKPKKDTPPEIISVSSVVAGVFEILQQEFKSSSIRPLFTNIATNDTVQIDRDGLFQAILNCILNSIDASLESKNSENGQIESLCFNRTDINGKQWLFLEIKDNGVGMTESVKRNIFDPFFTTKQQGHGTGLGLFVSFSLIESAGGMMSVESERNRSTKITISLPVSS